MDIAKAKKEYINLQKKLSELSSKLQTEVKNEEKTELFLNRKEYGKLSKKSEYLAELIKKIEQKKNIEKEIKDNKKIIQETDNRELEKLAKEEIQNLEKQKKNIEKEINKESSKDKSKENEILVEIRAGAGGEEAALFGRKLFEMYQKFSQKMKWHLTVLACHTTDLGGFKEISFEIKGKNAKEYLKNESGVHRVQRIPETEKMGRIHTSTISIAVLEKPKSTETELNQKDLRIDVYRASGPGGQYVNRRDSAVRIIHIPTGIMVASQSARTQISNRENALSILKARLYQLQKEKEEKKSGDARKSQIGKSERAEKIRTYNFPQDRITDHRIKKSWGNIEKILNGDLNEIINTLKEKMKS